MAQQATNKAWEIIFKDLDIISKLKHTGLMYISTKQIKEISNREPRLMCKFDDRFCRAEILKENNITILPVKNGEYLLVNGDGYQDLPSINDSIEFLEWSFEKKYQTLPREPRSESQVIDLVFATGLLTYFTGENDLTLTIRGRLRSAPFKFLFTKEDGIKHEITVEGVQVEVDVGYESPNKVYLIEAKMGERDDFHVRQLFYPMRMWMEEGITKEVIPLFITYANEIISIS